MKKIISFSIILAGFTAMASQIIFMREFLTVFYGNELSMALILASWLIGGAIGSAILGRVSDKIKAKIAAFSICEIGLAVLMPAGILLLRSIRLIINVSPGEIVPLFPMIMSGLVIICPVCIILGFMFSLACRIYGVRLAPAEIRIGKVYILEAIGSMTGGLTASFILIPLLNPVQIIAILSLANILAAFLLYSTEGSILLIKKIQSSPRFIKFFIALLIAIAAIWLFGLSEDLNKYSLDIEWRGHELIASKNSIYGNVTVTKRLDETSFFDNGLGLYTIPDKLTAEESVHFALLEHSNPKDILLVGGGAGLIEEILKQPVERVDYVELDPLIIKMAKDHLPEIYSKPLGDPRVSYKFVDGRLFIKTANQTYDSIIIHLGSPYTAQLNRYYTVEFFKELEKVLKKDGVLSFAVTSSENYINEDLKKFLRSIYITLKEVFRDVKIIPGDTAYFLASDKESLLTYDYKILMERARARKLDIKYVREYYLSSKLSPERVSYIEDSVKGANIRDVNYDFRPISYYYNTIFWTTYFKDSVFTKILRVVTEGRIRLAAIGFYILIVLLWLTGLRHRRLFKNASLIAVTTTGFSEMAFQIVVLLAFQIIYGYVFYKLGIILTSFMVGLVFGSWWIVKIMPRLKSPRGMFIRTQIAISLYPLVLPLHFWWLSTSKDSPIFWAGSNIIFPFLPVIAGFIGGFQFPLASSIYLDRKEDMGRVAGLNYGVDLLGACLGALLTGAFLIPVLGIPKTCILVAIMNFIVLMLVIFSRIFEKDK